MNENELKDKLNEYRTVMDGKKKELNEILSEVRIHQKEINTLRTLRDQGNDDCKALSIEAKKMREKRDELNGEISALKAQRKKLNESIKLMSGSIKDNKEKRDELNRNARGTDSSLLTRYEKDLETLINKDIPLEKEIKLFNTIFKLVDRVEAAKEATAFHKKILSAYDEIKALDDKADKISANIRALADESEKYHLKAIGIYSKVDEIRKSADESHAKLLEKYKLVSPLRDRLTAIKKEMDDLGENMSPYLGEMDKIRVGRDSEKKAQLAADAKEKLKTSKRISFDDLRAIMDDDAPSVTEISKDAPVVDVSSSDSDDASTKR